MNAEKRHNALRLTEKKHTNYIQKYSYGEKIYA